jgi:ribonuclease T2
MDALSRRKSLVVADFASAFAARNRGIDPSMLRLETNARGWLEEVFVCLNVHFRPQICDRGAESADSVRALKIWRGSR